VVWSAVQALADLLALAEQAAGPDAAADQAVQVLRSVRDAVAREQRYLARWPQLCRQQLANRLLAGGSSLKEVADVLRHRSLNTTLIYAKLDSRKLVAVVLGEPSVASRNDRATDLLENGFKRYFWKSLFGTRLDGLAIQASLSDSPTHLRDSVCGVARAKSTVRRSVKSKLHGLDPRGSNAPASAVSASEAN